MRFTLTGLLLFLALCAGAQRLVPFLKGKEWKVYDRALQQFTGKTYENAVPAKCGLVFVSTGGQWGALNNQGKLVIAQTYSSIQQLSQLVIAARDAQGILLTDTNGVAITTTRFKEAWAYKLNSTLVVAKDMQNKYGIVNPKGKTVLAFRYDMPPEHLGTRFLKVAVKKENGEPEYGLLDSTFKEIFPNKYWSIELADLNGNIRCRDANGTYHLYTPSFKELYAGPYRPTRVCPGFVYVDDSEDRYGFVILKTGKAVFATENGTFRMFERRGVAVAYSDERADLRFYHANGDTFQLRGYSIHYLDEHLDYCVVRKGSDHREKQGIADFKGNVVVPCSFNITIWNNRYFSASVPFKDDKGRNAGRYELYEISTGKKASPTQYEGIELLPRGGVALKENGSWKLYNAELVRWDNLEYNMVYRGQRLSTRQHQFMLYEVTRTVDNRSCKGYVDGECRPVIPAVYYEVHAVQSNYNIDNAPPGPLRIIATWEEPVPGSRYGKRKAVMLDGQGRTIPTCFELSALGVEMNGFLLAYRIAQYEDETRNFCGLIDTMGNVVLPLEYDEIRQLGPGQGFICTRNGVAVLANERGKILTGPGFSYAYPLDEKYTIATKNNRKGILVNGGEAATRFEYDEIRNEVFLNGTLFRVKKNGVEFYVDNTGKEYYEP